MRTLFDGARRSEMLDRIARVTTGSQPRWGKMSAEQMLAHLVLSLRIAVGELPAKSAKLPLRFPPLRQLVVYWLPVPKGLETAPEMVPSGSPSLEASLGELRRLLREFGLRAALEQWPEHPAFGKVGRRGWGVLEWKHMDHHLRQFGV